MHSLAVHACNAITRNADPILVKIPILSLLPISVRF